MMAFPSMLVSAAEKANMKVPADPDNFEKNEHPHFFVFCCLQLGKPMQPGEHWDNAKVIADIGDEELKTMTIGDFVDKGFQI